MPVVLVGSLIIEDQVHSERATGSAATEAWQLHFGRATVVNTGLACNIIMYTRLTDYDRTAAANTDLARATDVNTGLHRHTCASR